MKPVVFYTLQKHVAPNDPRALRTAAVWTCATCDNVIDGMGGPGNGEICEECAKRILAGNGRLRRRIQHGKRGNSGWSKENKERIKEFTSKGGKSAAPENRTFAMDKELASRAGVKGGSVKRPKDG